MSPPESHAVELASCIKKATNALIDRTSPTRRNIQKHAMIVLNEAMIVLNEAMIVLNEAMIVLNDDDIADDWK